MSTTRSTTRKPVARITTVTIGAPLAELPQKVNRPGATTPPAQHWMEVAAACRAAEGQWLPVSLGERTTAYYKQAASSIRNAGKDPKGLYAFRSGGYDAEYIDEQLYVRYAPTPILTAVPRKKASA